MAAALAAAGMAGQAHAADLEIIEEQAFVGAWYWRAFVGASNQQLGNLDNVLFHTGGTVVFLDSGSFNTAPFFGVGLGYSFNEWLRTDVTAEYRYNSSFHGLDAYDFNNDGKWDGSNEYSGHKSEWLFLANAYFDLGTWRGITPFVGAGIGTSRNTISKFRDVNAPNAGIAYADSDSQWNLAWALHAGFAWHVTPNVTLDLAYRYVDLGDAQTGDLVAYDGTNAFYNPMYFNDITSHDVYLGLRYNF
jgi:opacity protein-like surface antigen